MEEPMTVFMDDKGVIQVTYPPHGVYYPTPMLPDTFFIRVLGGEVYHKISTRRGQGALMPKKVVAELVYDINRGHYVMLLSKRATIWDLFKDMLTIFK